MWRRSESEAVHSQRRSQASWREVWTGMDGSLAERLQTTNPDPAGGRTAVGATPAGPPEGGEVIVQRTTRRRARAASPPTRQATLRPPMEKFVIEGGVPLS